MAQLHILCILHGHGQMPMSRLADVLDVSLSNATGLIDRMEERGFVERHPRSRGSPGRPRPGHAGRASGCSEEIDGMATRSCAPSSTSSPGSQLRAVTHAMSAFREAVAATVGSIPDRHPASTPTPRSEPTITGTDQTTQHGRD